MIHTCQGPIILMFQFSVRVLKIFFLFQMMDLLNTWLRSRYLTKTLFSTTPIPKSESCPYSDNILQLIPVNWLIKCICGLTLGNNLLFYSVHVLHPG